MDDYRNSGSGGSGGKPSNPWPAEKPTWVRVVRGLVLVALIAFWAALAWWAL